MDFKTSEMDKFNLFASVNNESYYKPVKGTIFINSLINLEQIAKLGHYAKRNDEFYVSFQRKLHRCGFQELMDFSKYQNITTIKQHPGRDPYDWVKDKNVQLEKVLEYFEGANPNQITITGNVGMLRYVVDNFRRAEEKLLLTKPFRKNLRIIQQF